MPPLKKRPYRGNDYSLTKRLRKVEALVKSNRAELKSITYVISGNLASGAAISAVPTQIAQGTDGNERIGDYINLVAVECRGHFDADMDLHLIQANGPTLPSAGTFTSGIGTFLLDSERDSRFREILHYRNIFTNTGASTPVHFKRRLTGRCYYNAAAANSAQRGQICVTAINRSGAVKDYNLSVRLWYRDP